MSELLFDQALAVVLGCLVLGLLLLLVEAVVTPGLGIPGVVGGLLLLAAIVVAFLRGPAWGTATLGASIVILGVTGYLLKVTVGKKLLLADAVPSAELSREGLADLEGREGVAVSALRPAGVARFGAQRVNVSTNGDFLEAGTAVVVTRVEGNRVKVQAAPRTGEA